MSEKEYPSPEELEFHAEWQKLALIAQALDAVELDKLAATVRQAEAVGPILYPTEYQDGHKNLAHQKRVVEAATHLRDTFAAVLKSERS